MRKVFWLSLMICVMFLVSVSLTFGQWISIDPTSGDYGDVNLGSSLPIPFTISNLSSSQVLSVTLIELRGDHPGDFLIDDDNPFDLEPLASEEIVVTFIPTDLDNRSATLFIENNSINKPELEVPLSGTGIAPDIAIDPTEWTDEVLVNDFEDITFTVSNHSDATADLAISDIDLTGATEFTIISGDDPVDPIAPGGTHQIVVRFAPTSEGLQEDTLEITSNDPDTPILPVPLSGTGVAPDIAIEPEFWTGDVLVNDIEDITFTVSNQGTATADLAISSIDLTGATEFSIISGDDPVDPIAPGGTHQIVVRFAPTSEGLQEDTLEITSNDPDTPILPVPLSGTGIAPDISVVPPEGDFGIVDIGEYETANYRDITFEVSNVGDSGTVLDVTSVTLTGTDASEFSTSDDEPFSLTPEDPPHEIVVRFEPTTGGFKEAYLSIENNDPDYEGAPLDVYLYGTGNPLDLIPPEIVEIGLDPPNGSILDIEPQDVTIPFSEPMDTESVLKNSEFVRINITDDVTEMRASICTFLYWFGNPNQADKYNGYGCNPPYGIAPDAGPNGKIDVTFNEPDNDTLTIHIEDLTIGQPDQPITEDTEYLLRILVNGATDLSGNVLALTHLDYTYFLTQQVEVTAGGGSFPSLLHDESLTVNIPGVSENTQLTAYTHFDPADTLPPPLWGEVEEPQIGIIKAFHLELGEEVTFTPPYGIQVQYNDSDIPPGEDENFLRLYQRDENENIWKFLVGSSVDTDNNIVSHNGLDQVNEPITVLGDFAVMWGYPYGDLYVLGSIELFDFQFIIFYVEEYWNIFAPEPGWPGESLDPDMAEIVADLNGDGVINVSDALQIMNYILYDEPFGVFGAPRLMHPLSNVAHTAFLSRDALSNRVSIVLDDATDVFAADIELTYNPRLLKISEVSKTSLTSDSLISYDDRNAGKLRSILVNLPLNGAGSLMDVQFELMPGASRTAAFDSIKLTKVKLNAGLIKTTLGKLPQRLTLLQNYPNPFNPETWIPYELNQAADVEIRIYNINGQIVRRLSLGQQLPGSYITKDKAVYWDGANDKGEKVSSGVYFYQLKAGEKSLVRKMVIMK